MPARCLSVFIVCLFLSVSLPEIAAGNDSSVKQSVVQVHVQKTVPSYNQPWIVNKRFSLLGSGCIISDSHILTSAHVVSHGAFIHVSKVGDSNRYTADLLFISHEADLAILTVKDKEFFNDSKPIEMSRELVQTREEVTVYGFAVGGETLSATRGIVSRVEHEVYSHNVHQLLMSQIDAPINSGNSGGPVVVDGKLVGVVIQALARSENIGYMVPTPVIDHFLDDVKDGSYDGFPVLGVLTQIAQNPDLREKNLMPEDGGVLVTQVVAGSPAEGKILKGDVIVSIDGVKISSNGTVKFRDNERTDFSYLVDMHQIGEDIKVEVLRGGEKMEMVFPLTKTVDAFRLVNTNYGNPSYYIFAGCVFSPLTFNYLKEWGARWFVESPSVLLSRLDHNVKEFPDQEVVFMMSVLPSEVNYGYYEKKHWIVDKVNGVRINNMRHLVKVVEREVSSSSFVTFQDSHGEEIVFSSEKAKRIGAALLATYQIDKDRSPDLVVPIFENRGL